MFEVTKLIRFTDSVDESERETVLSDLASDVAPHARHTLIRPTLPGGIAAGDAIARFRFDTESDWRAAQNDVERRLWTAAVAHVDSVTHTGTPRPAKNETEPTVYRTLLVAVDPATDPNLVRQFESETAHMPDHIAAIGASQLSRVHDASGTARWTHVWEQEYASLEGLTGPYMTHPYHWAHVDRWFDFERGQKVVTALCHSFCRIDEPLLTR
ncbi:stress responsive alpha/beta barrel protein [Rhodococcus sp. OK519]|uniref:Dabb family protein n=1 Tax=Rhodococcus sp. OK519 TaxID=2135729 RepID=UPI000D3C85D1|nr:stress responsive alpha/beta barrel protein [Rhodococcus sp. OK519]